VFASPPQHATPNVWRPWPFEACVWLMRRLRLSRWFLLSFYSWMLSFSTDECGAVFCHHNLWRRLTCGVATCGWEANSLVFRCITSVSSYKWSLHHILWDYGTTWLIGGLRNPIDHVCSRQIDYSSQVYMYHLRNPMPIQWDSVHVTQKPLLFCGS
jgi:hypothetical protein